MLEEALANCQRMMLDTMIFSYHFADHPRYGPLTQVMLNAVEKGEVEGLTSTITLAEVLTRPAQVGDRQAMRDYELYLTHFPHLCIVPLDVALAQEAAMVRANTGLRMPDAIQIAAALAHGADTVVGNDLAWRNKVGDLRLLLLDDYLKDHLDSV